MDQATKSQLQYLLDLAKLPNKPLVTMAALTMILEIVASPNSIPYAIYLQDHGLASILIECLDPASSLQENSLEDMLAMIAMKLCHHMSTFPSLVVQNLTMVTFFKRLLRFVDMDGFFFNYGKKYRQLFTSLTKGKTLTANVSVEKLLSEECRILLDSGIVDHPSILPKQIWRCTCFDPSAMDLDIGGHLISKTLAWPSAKQGETESGTGDDRTDMIVTETLERNYFCAVVGAAGIEQLQKITSIMKECEKDLVRGKVEVGKILAVADDRDGKTEHVRAQVLSQQGEWVKVVLVDLGGVREVRMCEVYELPSILGLLYFPAQSTLCNLAGVQAAPTDPYLAQSALASMCNLLRHGFTAGVNLMQANGVRHLLDVLQCPDPTMVLQAARVLNNMARNPIVDRVMFERVLLDLLAMLRRLPRLICCAIVREDICRSSLCCLANLLYLGKDYRDLFYQNEGLSIVLHLMKQYNPKCLSFRTGILVIRNFLHVREVQNPIPSNIPISSMDARVDVVSLKDKPHPAPLVGEDSSSEEDLEPAELPRPRCDSADSLVAGRTEASTNPSSQVVAVNCAEADDEQGQMYLYDAQIDLCNDVTHELRPHSRLSQVSASCTARIACGMLNSKGGTVYFGITKEHRTQGVKISRDERDSFRLGVDEMMMNKISPAVLYIQYDMVYVPVFLGGRQTQPSLVPDLYIVELTIRPSKGSMHTVQGECLYRFGPNTLSLSTMEMRELVVVAEEDSYMDEITALQTQLKNMSTCV